MIFKIYKKIFARVCRLFESARLKVVALPFILYNVSLISCLKENLHSSVVCEYQAWFNVEAVEMLTPQTRDTRG